MQELQCHKEGLERDLRVVKQERNALALTLRQHGFLGKSGRSGLVPSHHQQQAHADLRSMQAAAKPDIDEHNNTSNLNPSQSMPKSVIRHQSAPDSSRHMPLSPAPARCAIDLPQRGDLMDVTNTLASTPSSPAARSSTHEDAATHKSHSAKSEARIFKPSQHHFQQSGGTQSVQARLHDMERLAQELLL